MPSPREKQNTFGFRFRRRPDLFDQESRAHLSVEPSLAWCEAGRWDENPVGGLRARNYEMMVEVQSFGTVKKKRRRFVDLDRSACQKEVVYCNGLPKIPFYPFDQSTFGPSEFTVLVGV